MWSCTALRRMLLGVCKRYWTPNHWHQTQRAHHSDTLWHVALAASHSVHWVQDCADDLQLRPWYESCLFPRHLSSSHICQGPCDAEVSQLRGTRWARTRGKCNAASVSPHRLFGTIYHDIYATVTLVVKNSLATWKHFCSHGPIRQRRLWERLFKSAFYKWTYLLTYLLNSILTRAGCGRQCRSIWAATSRHAAARGHCDCRQLHYWKFLSDKCLSANVPSALQRHLSGTLCQHLFWTATLWHYLKLDVKLIFPLLLLGNWLDQRLRSYSSTALSTNRVLLLWLLLLCLDQSLNNRYRSYDVGGDDRRILLWDVERSLSDAGLPAVMKGEHHSNIFCVAFNNSNTRIYSGGEPSFLLCCSCVSWLHAICWSIFCHFLCFCRGYTWNKIILKWFWNYLSVLFYG